MPHSPAFLRLGALKVIKEGRLSHSAGEENGVEGKCFPRLAKSVGMKEDWLFHGLEKAGPSRDILHIDQPSVVSDQRAFQLGMSGSCDN